MRKKSDKINNFHFECNKVLTKELGQFDALVQFQEVALLDMLSAQKEIGEDIDTYIKKNAKKHNIPLGHVPFSKFLSKIHQSYLIYPSACLDRFLKDWVQEMYLFLGKPDDNDIEKGFRINGKKEEAYLQSVLSALKHKGYDLGLSELYLNIFEYYRLSRNSVVHISRDKDRITNVYNKIDRVQALKLLPAWQNAFARPCEYELDDLVAYSAFVKRIADEMTSLLYPKLDWTCIHYEYDEEWMAMLKKTRAKPDRKKTLQGFIKQRYGEPIPNGQIDKVMEYLHL